MQQNQLRIPIVFFFLLFSFYTCFSPADAGAFAQNDQTTSGTVLETMNSSGYTYMLVDSAGVKTWVAIPETKIEKGEKVTYASGMVMENFNSKTLNRTFDAIVFSPGIVGGKAQQGHGAATDDSFSAAVQNEQSQAAPSAPQNMPMGSSGGSLGAITPFKDITVAKSDAPNGHTVEEIYAQAKELDGKKVILRGVVTKVSANIMGRNWIHLQDGTGNPMSNTHDIVVTSSEAPELNSKITIEGVVAAEKDFGAGYKYAVIIEEASTQK